MFNSTRMPTAMDNNIEKQTNDSYTTKDQEIYSNIYTAIVEHYIAPGTKLPEDAIAESFDVSRTIIRKVLLSLAHEGLVTIEPKRGAKVSKPTAKEGREVFAARKLIEVAAIPSIVKNAHKEDVSNLRLLVKKQRDAQDNKDYRAAIRLSGEFHLALMQVTRNQTLIEFLRSLVSKSSLIVAVYGSTSKSKAKSCQDHDELIDLLQDNNVQQCQKWMQRHLEHVEDSLDFGDHLTGPTDLKKIFSEIQNKN